MIYTIDMNIYYLSLFSSVRVTPSSFMQDGITLATERILDSRGLSVCD